MLSHTLQAKSFTRSHIYDLRYNVKGVPIIVDDLTSLRFSQHAVETIKNDDFGVADHLDSYPAVVISANEDIKVVSPEIVRRAIICHVKAGLKNTEMIKINTVRKVHKNIGTAIYRAYLGKMLDVLPNMLNELKNDLNDCGPDLIKISSEVLLEIFKDNADTELPDYFREISIEDFFDEKVTGSQSISKITEAWNINKKAFKVDKKQAFVAYDAGEVWEADRIIKEIPEDLEAHRSREYVVMKLEEASKFFEIDFVEDTKLISKIKNLF